MCLPFHAASLCALLAIGLSAQPVYSKGRSRVDVVAAVVRHVFPEIESQRNTGSSGTGPRIVFSAPVNFDKARDRVLTQAHEGWIHGLDASLARVRDTWRQGRLDAVVVTRDGTEVGSFTLRRDGNASTTIEVFATTPPKEEGIPAAARPPLHPSMWLFPLERR